MNNANAKEAMLISLHRTSSGGFVGFLGDKRNYLGKMISLFCCYREMIVLKMLIVFKLLLI